MFCGKRRREHTQEGCDNPTLTNPQEKRACRGVSGLDNPDQWVNHCHTMNETTIYMSHTQTNNMMPKCSSMETEQTVPHYSQPNGHTPHLMPASPRRCVRCLSGEPGHINHILG